MDREISWPRIGAALVALAGCAYAQWTIRQDATRGDAGLWLVGAALVAAALLGRPRSNDPATATPSQATRTGSMIWLAVTAAGFFAYAYGIHLLTQQWHYYFDVAVPLAIAGIAIWSIGIGRYFRPAAGLPWPRWEVVLFVVILGIGLFARFYRYDYYPPDGVCAVEEPQSGQITYQIVHSKSRPWEFVGDRWLGVPFFYFFGESMLTLRFPYSVVSWLTLIPFYLLMRLVVSRPAALFSAALFALSSWHLMYARLAHNIFPTTLIAVLVMYLCVRVHRRGGLGMYPWIGFLCGYTLYTYAGYRATPGFAAIFLGLSFCGILLAWQRARTAEETAAAGHTIRLQVIGLLMALTAFIGPILVLQQRLTGENRGHFFEAIKRSVVNSEYYTSDFLPRLRERVTMTAKLFNHVGDGSETFNLPGEPMLDPVTGTLFALALVYCVLWWRHRWQGYFAFIFLALLIGGAIMVGNFDPRRLQGIIPLIYVTIGFTADRFIAIGRARLGRAAPGVLLVIGAGVLSVTYYLNWDLFFVRTINDPRVRQAFQNRYTVAVRYLKTLPDGAFMLFVSDVPYFFQPSDLEFFRGHRIPGVVTSDLLPVFRGDRGPWNEHDLRILMQEPFEHEAIAKLILATFPDATCENATHPERPPQSMTGCHIPHPDRTSFTGGLRARYYLGTENAPFLDRLEPAISYGLLPDVCQFPRTLRKPPCRIEWEGVLHVPEDGSYRFVEEARHGSLGVMIDGEPLQKTMSLTKGKHAIRAEARFASSEDESGNGARLLWAKVPGAPLELVRFGKE